MTDKKHPEVEDLKNICDITPDDKTTKDVCKKVNKSDKKVDNINDSANKSANRG